MSQWVEMVLRLVVATALAAVIGYDREVRGKAAGMRTHVMIALGAAAFTLASLRSEERRGGPQCRSRWAPGH